MRIQKKRIRIKTLCAGGAVIFIFLFFGYGGAAPKNKEGVQANGTRDGIYGEYLAFFEEVYDAMAQNYYLSLEREQYNRFIDRFKKDIYGRLTEQKRAIDYIRWRSAAYLVDYLRDPQDTFSAFIPPKPAREFEQQVLGVRIDLGIEGRLSEKGYEVARVEPRADTYLKGLREQDIIRTVNDADVTQLSEQEIEELLTPEVGTTTVIRFVSAADGSERVIDVVSKEYFRQTVFMVPVPVPDVYCLEIRSFNRMTAQDMFLFLRLIEEHGGGSLIIDLRGNPGGPPLAARELSAFFLPPNEQLAYFQRRGHPRAMLDVPAIAEEYRYTGPMVILVNEQSGSSSELFSGTLQRHGRAVLMGTNTAGNVFLKSMFHFDDESMLVLITSRGYFPDGSVFDFEGIAPDYRVQDDSANMILYAALYLHSAAARAAQQANQ